MIRSVRAIAIGVLIAALPALATADEVRLRNGDRLSGRVISKSGELLNFETPYAGILKIRWAEVASLSTDQPVEIFLVGARQPVRSRIESEPGGPLRLVGNDTSAAPEQVAFINPKPEESGIGTAYTGRVSASTTNARGNAVSDRIYAEADLTARARQYRYGLGGKINRASESGTLSASSWLGRANYDRFLDQSRFLYVRGSLEHDSFKDIDLRTSVGAGYGKDLIQTPRFKLSLRAGIDHIGIDHTASANESFPALGWGLQALYKFADAGLEAFHDHEGYWNLEDRDSVSMRSRTGLRIPVFKSLSATAQLNVDWDRAPAPGRKPADSTLLLGATYSW